VQASNTREANVASLQVLRLTRLRSRFCVSPSVPRVLQGSAYGLAAPGREAYSGRRLAQAPVAEAPVPEAPVAGPAGAGARPGSALSSHSSSATLHARTATARGSGTFQGGRLPCDAVHRTREHAFGC